MARPDPAVELKALTAMALDLTRVDPDRPPGERLAKWHRELAEVLGDTASPARTNRELLRDAVRLTKAQKEPAAIR